MKTIALGYTQTNWHEFMQLAKSVLGRSPTASLDDANLRPGDPFSYIAALEESLKRGTTPRDAALYATYTLEHVHFSFATHVNDKEWAALTNIPMLKVLDIIGEGSSRAFPDHLLIFTGNLLEWKIVQKTCINYSPYHIELFTQIFMLFKKMNLRELFD